MINLGQLKSAINEPSKIPPYIIGKLFPNSKFGPWYRMENGKIVRDNYNDRLLAEFGKDIYVNFKLFEEMFGGEDKYNRILDVGCGMGWRLPWYSEYGEEVWGVDVSEDGIDIASEIYDEYEFRCCPAQNMPFDDNEFDLVSTWTVLMHMSDDDAEEAAKEITRITEEGGTLVIYEDIRGEGKKSEHIWSRDISDYRDMFDGFEFIESFKREPGFESASINYDIQIYECEW